MRLLQISLLLPQHAVDAPADFLRLPLGLALFSAQLVRASPPLFLRGGFGPRARQAPVGARWERDPRRIPPSRRGRGRGQALPRAPRGRFRARAGGILRISKEQRSQTVTQTHVGAARARGRLAPGSRQGPSSEAGVDCTWTHGGVAAGPNQGPRPLTALKGHFAFSAGRTGWRLPGMEIT